jgi:hypothetical protein
MRGVDSLGIYFSISLSMVRTAVARVDCPLHFMISYFSDGDLHAYGSRASYRYTACLCLTSPSRPLSE